MIYALQFLLAFSLMFISDACFALYTRRANRGDAWQAAAFAALIAATSGVTVISYTTDKTLLIAVILGAFFGTLTSIKWDIRSKK